MQSNSRRELALFQIAFAQKSRFVEGYHRFGVDADQGETAAVALQQLGERSHEDGSDLFVQHHGLGGAHRQRRERVVGAAQFRLQDQTESFLGVAEEGLGQQGQGDAVRNGYGAAVEVSDYHVHLKIFFW
jgi:hypothetical protein